MEKNKTAKYFKYAIGEIILVVIGILIALQINIWNEKRKETNQTVGLLNNMITDLKTDINNLERNINLYNGYITSSRMLLSTNDYQLLSADSIYNLLPTNASSNKIIDVTFEKLKNIGTIKILDSEDLFNAITNYYTNTTNYLEMGTSWDFEYSLKATDFWRLGERFEAPILNDTIVTPFIENELERKTTLVNELSSIQSRNHIRYAISRKQTVLNIFKYIKSAAENLIVTIEQELEKINSK
jgi:hypothetical protein